MSVISLSRTILRNLFSKPATRLYPFEAREYPARTRGHIGIDIEACIHCGICSKKCPTGAITVNRDAKTWSIRRMGCIQCGACTEFCPKKCLSMQTPYTEPNAVKTEDTFVQAPKPAAPAPASAPAQAAAPASAPASSPTHTKE